jgi:hypothetical protein
MRTDLVELNSKFSRDAAVITYNVTCTEKARFAAA